MQMLHTTACKAIDDSSAKLNDLAQEIWSHPEEKFQETFAHYLLTTFLKDKGFTITSEIGDLKTSFRAVYNENIKRLRVGIICEYDALPKINHACGQKQELQPL